MSLNYDGGDPRCDQQLGKLWALSPTEFDSLRRLKKHNHPLRLVDWRLISAMKGLESLRMDSERHCNYLVRFDSETGSCGSVLIGRIHETFLALFPELSPMVGVLVSKTSGRETL